MRQFFGESNGGGGAAGSSSYRDGGRRHWVTALQRREHGDPRRAGSVARVPLHQLGPARTVHRGERQPPRRLCAVAERMLWHDLCIFRAPRTVASVTAAASGAHWRQVAGTGKDALLLLWRGGGRDGTAAPVPDHLTKVSRLSTSGRSFCRALGATFCTCPVVRALGSRCRRRP
jgi:hypothetical protein